jgi:thiol-disulfide isomerase/thioredoxin
MMCIKTVPNIFILLLYALTSCSNNTDRLVLNNGNKQIVLIFKSTPAPWKEYFRGNENSAYTPAKMMIEFTDDNFIPVQFSPDPTRPYDTLVINTKRKSIDFEHSYKGFDKLTYIFKSGDTVLFEYFGKSPHASVLNRKTKEYDINFDLYIRESLNSGSYPSYVKFIAPMFFMDFKLNDFQTELKRVSELAKDHCILELNQENHLLDSLQKNKLISDEAFNYYRYQLIYKLKIIELQSLLGQNTIKPLFRALKKVDFNIKSEYNIELGWMNGRNILDKINDSLMYFGYQNDIINWVYYNYLSRKVGRVISTNYTDNIADAGSNLPDYISLYDTLANCNLLSAQVVNLLRFKTVQNIIENNPIDKSKRAFEKFANDVKDTSFINFVRRKYFLFNDNIADSLNLQLISTNGEQINFKQLLGKFVGNIIYVDFWSSGCMPCIKEFEFSRKLQNTYKDKNFVHLYISVEPDQNRWLRACYKYKLCSESYFLKNKYTSKQFEEMNIKYLPHYILYDKKGILASEYAPRPSDRNLIKLLEKFLNE